MAYLSRDKRREQIVEGVIRLVVQEGLAAATVRRIAQELACSPGQIHHHFATADALRAEAVRGVWQQIGPLLLEEIRPLPPRERLRALLSGDVCHESQIPQQLLEVSEKLWREAWHMHGDSEVRAALAEGFDSMRQELLAALADGIAAGAFRADLDIERTALRLQGLSAGLAFIQRISEIHVPADLQRELIDESLDALLVSK